MKYDNLLKTDNTIVLADLLRRCKFADANTDTQSLQTLAELSAKATNANQPLPEQLNIILERWYNSLVAGTPDYSVYAESEYIAELWACWKVYSKTHLNNIQKVTALFDHSITEEHSDARTIVDLGCGFAYTTAALTQIFPQSSVWGTNLPNTLQMTVAQSMATDYGFTMADSPSGIPESADLIFASEYFEHFQRPIEHLDHVIDTLRPRAMLIANAFGPIAIGHFRNYEVQANPHVGWESIDAKTTGKLFNQRMRQHGYTKVKTKLWNSRPAYWVKTN